MSISITDRDDLLDEDLRHFAERRLLFALSRFDSRISHVDLAVLDERGSRGDIAKSCRVSVSLRRMGEVIVSDQDAELGKCISRATEKAGRAVARVLARSQSFDRSRPLTLD